MGNPYIASEENPVQVLRPLTRGSTTFRWGTGDGSNGVVYLSIDDATPTLFSPVAGQTPTSQMPPAGNPNVPLPSEWIKVGSRYAFTLYRASDKSRQMALARVVVTAESVSNTGVGVIGGGVLGFIQLIRNLNVAPGPDFADFTYDTTQPSATILQVAREMPGPGPAFDLSADGLLTGIDFIDGRQMHHQWRIGSAAYPMSQDTTYYFIITADNIVPGSRATTLVGSFKTGVRNARVTFDNIRVWRNGANYGDGDMVFSFFGFDGTAGNSLGEADPYEDSSVGDGDYLSVTRDLYLEQAPPTLELYVKGFHIYSDWWNLVNDLLGVEAVDYGPGGTAPAAADHGDDSDAVWASTLDTFDLPTGSGNLPSQPITLDSGPWGVAFTVYGTIQTTIIPGEWSGPRMGMRSPRSRIGFARDIGQVAAVLTGPGRVVLFQRGPAGSVLLKTIDRAARGGGRGDWRNLGGKAAGPVTALATNAGRLYLFAPGPDGNVLSVDWGVDDDGPAAPGTWNDLGGKVVGQITASDSVGGPIHLLALDRAGSVVHGLLRPRTGEAPRVAWEELGGEFAGPVTTVAGEGGRLGVFAIRRCGGVCGKSWHENAWAPAGHRWDDLGGDFIASLVPVAEQDGRFALIGFGADRSVYRKTWDGHRWEPAAEKWEHCGDAASLVEDMPAGGEVVQGR